MTSFSTVPFGSRLVVATNWSTLNWVCNMLRMSFFIARWLHRLPGGRQPVSKLSQPDSDSLADWKRFANIFHLMNADRLSARCSQSRSVLSANHFPMYLFAIGDSTQLVANSLYSGYILIQKARLPSNYVFFQLNCCPVAITSHSSH